MTFPESYDLLVNGNSVKTLSFASETPPFRAGMKRSPEAKEKPRPLGRGDSLESAPRQEQRAGA